MGGYAASSAVIGATEISGVMVSTAGISTIVSNNALVIPKYVHNSGSMISWARQALEETKIVLTLPQVKQIFNIADAYGIKITAHLLGPPNTNWPMAHIGKQRIHIAVAKETIKWITKQLY